MSPCRYLPASFQMQMRAKTTRGFIGNKEACEEALESRVRATSRFSPESNKKAMRANCYLLCV